MEKLMTETQIIEAIVRMKNSKEYLELTKYYAEESLMKILHVSRDEKVHSNFIAWILNQNYHHELNYFPLKKILQLLSVVAKNENNLNARFLNENVDRFLLEDYELDEYCTVKTEVPTGNIAGFDNNGRIDILITLSFKNSNKKLPIIIENKVLSTENDENKKTKNSAKNKQTQKYYDWSEEYYKDQTKYETPILIFLAPDFEQDIKCSCDQFIKVSYQNLVDFIIEPCMMYTSNIQAKFFIENYLRCLSNSTINNETNKKEGRIMAFIGKERELLEKFHEKNKDLIDAVLTMLATDPNLSAEDRKSMNVALNVANSKDYSKYMFDGNTYGKGKLVLAVVKKYVDDNPQITFAELQEKFPDTLQSKKKSKYGVVRLDDDNTVDPKDKGIGGGVNRYFTEDKVKLPNQGKEVIVCNQWGKDNIPIFINHVVNNLGYDIQKI